MAFIQKSKACTEIEKLKELTMEIQGSWNLSWVGRVKNVYRCVKLVD